MLLVAATEHKCSSLTRYISSFRSKFIAIQSYITYIWGLESAGEGLLTLAHSDQLEFAQLAPLFVQSVLAGKF